jgi:hypothetical protein
VSNDIVLSTGRDDENKHRVVWTSGLVPWVVEQIRDAVVDEQLKRKIDEFLKTGYSLFSFNYFSDPEIEEMAAVVVGPLLSLARREWTPDNDLYDTPTEIEGFVGLTRAWLAAVNAQRREEDRPELRPSLG